MQRLHATIDPAYFSTSFRPMNHLVSVLSAEAKHREKLGPSGAREDDESDDDADEALRVHTLEGEVARLVGLSAESSVAELRLAVEDQVGVSVEYQRLYVDGSEMTHRGVLVDHSLSSLELLNDGSKKLGELGVFPARRGEPPLASLHLRNREYEALRTQLAVATQVVEEVLERHYDTFKETVADAQRMSDRFDQLDKLVADARRVVADARASLGLRHHAHRHHPAMHDDHLTDAAVDDDDDDDDKAARVLEQWEEAVEAEEVLTLLDELRAHCLDTASPL